MPRCLLYGICLVKRCTTLAILCLFCSTASNAVELDDEQLAEFRDEPWEFAKKHVQESREFYGLASYYNNLTVLLLKDDDIRLVEAGGRFALGEEDTLAIVGRFKALLVSGSSLEGSLTDTETLKLHPGAVKLNVAIVEKKELAILSGQLDDIRYHHLWWPLAWLAKIAESILVFIQTQLVSSWGMAILLFTLVMKVFLLPLNFYSVAAQRRVSILQSAIEPRVDAIKKSYDGEEAHNRMMAVYREQGVTPFYLLRPLLVSLIQVPILIAIFNALGEMSQLSGASFYWIDDLAYPDSIGSIGASIPLLGKDISVLPWLMTAITISAALLFENRYSSPAALKGQRRNLYFMAAAFLVLFYPFPAAMVLFWTATNLLQTAQQQMIKI